MDSSRRTFREGDEGVQHPAGCALIGRGAGGHRATVLTDHGRQVGQSVAGHGRRLRRAGTVVSWAGLSATTVVGHGDPCGGLVVVQGDDDACGALSVAHDVGQSLPDDDIDDLPEDLTARGAAGTPPGLGESRTDTGGSHRGQQVGEPVPAG